MAAAGCGDPVTGPPGPPVELRILDSIPAQIVATARTPMQLRARVTDANGRGVPGIRVFWSVRRVDTFGSLGFPGGQVQPFSDSTDADGIARAVILLDSIAGAHVISASTQLSDGSALASQRVEVQVLRGPIVALQPLTDTLTLTVGTTVDYRTVPVDVFGNADTTAAVTLEMQPAGVVEQTSRQLRAVAPGTALVIARSSRATDGSNPGFSVVDTIRIVVPEPARFAMITAGDHHSCGTTLNGATACWGLGAAAPPPRVRACGFGAALSDCTPAPQLVPGAPVLQSIDAGANYTCGLANSVAYCWGNGGIALGNGGTSIERPLPVTTELRFASISAGTTHTCALTAAGEAYCWGRNGVGQLGTNNLFDAATPVRSAQGFTFTAISAGGTNTSFSGGHSCGISSDGNAWCWGGNASGELGRGFTTTTEPRGEPVPARVLVAEPLVRIMVGTRATTCGLTAGGNAYCWGELHPTRPGELATTHATPLLLSHSIRFQDLAIGSSAICGVDIDGIVYCRGVFGGAQADLSTPYTAVRFTRIVGGEHFCALQSSGAAHCWGSGLFGELGNGRVVTFSRAPVAVAPTR